MALGWVLEQKLNSGNKWIGNQDGAKTTAAAFVTLITLSLDFALAEVT